jgi:hypothetical protein
VPNASVRERIERKGAHHDGKQEAFSENLIQVRGHDDVAAEDCEFGWLRDCEAVETKEPSRRGGLQPSELFSLAIPLSDGAHCCLAGRLLP